MRRRSVLKALLASPLGFLLKPKKAAVEPISTKTDSLPQQSVEGVYSLTISGGMLDENRVYRCSYNPEGCKKHQIVECWWFDDKKGSWRPVT